MIGTKLKHHNRCKRCSRKKNIGEITSAWNIDIRADRYSFCLKSVSCLYFEWEEGQNFFDRHKTADERNEDEIHLSLGYGD